jgi:hypothetical protein
VALRIGQVSTEFALIRVPFTQAQETDTGVLMSWLQGRQAKRSDYPLAREDELIIDEVDGETLVYDRRNDEAHCLSAVAAEVWRACDGKTSLDQIGSDLGLDQLTADRALDELTACDLLQAGAKPGVTRREATMRFAKVGAAGAAIPLIWSIVGPISEAAASATVAFCAQGNTHGCGINCQALHCCCCCHGLPMQPTCAGGSTKCCFPTATCPTMGGFCSDTADCP